MKTRSVPVLRRPSLKLESLESRILLSVGATALPVADAIPIVAGAEWTYKAVQNGKPGMITTTMTVPSAGNVTLTSTSTSLEGSTEYYTTDSSGIYLAEQYSGSEFLLRTTSGSLKILPSVLTVGETFTSSASVSVTADGYVFTGTATGTGKITGWSTISLPAGKFLAIGFSDSFTMTGTGNVDGFPATFHGTETQQTELVPGIGIVSRQVTISGAGTAAGHSQGLTTTASLAMETYANLPALTPTALTAQVGTITIPNPAIPGDKGNVTVSVANSGEVVAGGDATIALYLVDSPSETVGGTLLATSPSEAITLGDGQSDDFTISNVQLPANTLAGAYYLRADVSATLTNPAENPPVSTQSFQAFSSAVPVVWEFGAVGTRHGVVLNVTATDGTTATFSLAGPGMGTVTDTAGVWDLGVTGSTSASSVTITTKKSTPGASGQISLDGITVEASNGQAEGPLASFSGADVNLTGAMAAGSVGSLTLDNLSNDGGINLGGTAAGRTTLTFNAVSDESLTCGNAIGSLTAASWEDADQDGTDNISAPGLASATIHKGDLAANLDITGQAGIGSLSITGGSLIGNVTDAGALTSLTVTGGGVSGDVSAARIGSLTVSGGNVSGNLTSNASAAALGAGTGIGSVTVTGGDLTGQVNSNGKVGAVTVSHSAATTLGGNVSGAWTLDSALASLTLHGGSLSSDISADGIGSVTVSGGSLSGNLTDTGALASLTVTGGGVTGNVSATKIGSVTVSGGDVSGNLTSNGTALQLGTANGIGSVTVTGGDLTDTVTSTGNVGSITVTRGAGTTGLGGNFTGDLTLSGALGSLTLTGGNLGGSLGATVDVTGALGSLTVNKSGTNGGNVAANVGIKAGTITTLHVAGSLQGVSASDVTLNAGTITTLSIAGSMDFTAVTIQNASRKATTPALTTMSVGGTMQNSQLISDGNISSVTVGAMDDSVAYAGVDTALLTPVDEVLGLPTVLADFSSQADIGSFTVAGLKTGTTPTFSFVGSNIAAYKLGTVSLSYADGSNGGIPFGVACHQYGTLNFRDLTGKTTTWRNSNPLATLATPDGVVRVLTT